MPREQQTLVFVGINDCVVALDDSTGEEVWRSELSGADYVTVLWDGEALLAANKGEVYRLDPRSGDTIWRNKLKGLGRGLVSLATTRNPSGTAAADATLMMKRWQQQAAAAAAAAAAAS